MQGFLKCKLIVKGFLQAIRKMLGKSTERTSLNSRGNKRNAEQLGELGIICFVYLQDAKCMQILKCLLRNAGESTVSFQAPSGKEKCIFFLNTSAFNYLID